MEKTSSFRLFKRTGRTFKAREMREGDLRINNEDAWPEIYPVPANPSMHRPFVCIKWHGNYIWKDLRELSGAKLSNYKLKISTKIHDLFKSFRSEINSHNVTKIKYATEKNKTTEMFVFMYNKLSVKDREEYIKKFPNMKEQIINTTCNVCNNLTNKNFVKCRHDDCKKMCTSCHNNWTNGKPIVNNIFVFGHLSSNPHSCPACNKSQLYTCPICYEDKPTNKIMKADNCSHFICKNCFCQSFNSQPVVDCPMCRKQFRKTLSKTKFNDGLPEESIV